MDAADRPTTRTTAGRNWDRYVEVWDTYLNADGTHRWPGDEWGDPRVWDQLYTRLFEPAGAAQWGQAVEVGPGSGKYTELLLGRSGCTVRAYDVSAGFLQVCQERCSRWVSEGRLSLHLIEGRSPAEMLDDLAAAGLLRRLDGFFSMDAMVHVDLQYLVVYLMVAALALREGGKLVMTVANVTSDQGLEKLLADVAWTYPIQNDPPGGKFEWVSPDLISHVMGRLGFNVELSLDRRDIGVVGTLVDVAPAAEIEQHLRREPPRPAASFEATPAEAT